MSKDDARRWDQKWRDFGPPPEPNGFLLRYSRHLGTGTALDVACGLGQNSVWLARQGYRVVGVDRSLAGLRQASAWADEHDVARRTTFVLADLDHWRPAPESVDLVCVFRFLDRKLIPALRRAVRPGGLMIYQTRHTGVLRRQPDATAEYLLTAGELERLFVGWQLIAYEEDEENAGIIERKPS